MDALKIEEYCTASIFGDIVGKLRYIICFNNISVSKDIPFFRYEIYVPYGGGTKTIRNGCTLIHFSADATGAVAGVDAMVAVATTAELGATMAVAVAAFFTASKTLSST